ncbi:retrovirus-related pol polyprotein from transposon TNT 1-94, partial [Tanacetum coccineum]
KVVKDRASGLSKGFGFLQYYIPEGAATSIEAMDGKDPSLCNYVDCFCWYYSNEVMNVKEYKVCAPIGFPVWELRPNDDISGGDGGRFTNVLRRRFLKQVRLKERRKRNHIVMRFLVLGWHLEEIYVTWAHLEKKRTRLRLYTKNHEELFTQSLETTSQP